MKYDFVSHFASQMNANIIIRANYSNEVCHLEITKLSAIKKLFSLTQEHFQKSGTLTSLEALDNFTWSEELCLKNFKHCSKMLQNIKQ